MVQLRRHLDFRELGLATVPVILGARDLEQLRLYLSISTLLEKLSICSGKIKLWYFN